MKHLYLIFACIFFSATAFAQSNMNCCAPTATEKFAMLANDKAFVQSHEEPVPFEFVAQRGKDMNVKSPDGTDAHLWVVKAKKNSAFYLFVIHEWWGLNDYVKKASEQMSDDLDINVVALDLYDNKVAATREDAQKYMGGVTTERAKNIIKAAYNFAGSSAKIFTIGWCFGGGWSLQTSIEGGEQAAGCIMYYGMPEKDQERLSKLNCDVLGIFASKDGWITPAVVDEFKENMKKAGKKISVYQYDADHAFANPSNPKYDKVAAEDAYNKVLTFIKLRMN